MSGSDRSRHSAKSDNPRTVHHGRWNGGTWRLSRQTASKIGTVESRRFLVSQPFGCDIRNVAQSLDCARNVFWQTKAPKSGFL